MSVAASQKRFIVSLDAEDFEALCALSQGAAGAAFAAVCGATRHPAVPR